MKFFKSSGSLRDQLNDSTSRSNAYAAELEQKRSELDRLADEHRSAAMACVLAEGPENVGAMARISKQIVACKERIETIEKLVEAGAAVREKLEKEISTSARQEELDRFDREIPALFSSCPELEMHLKRIGELFREHHQFCERNNNIKYFSTVGGQVSLYSRWQYWVTAAVGLHMGGILPTVPGGLHGEEKLREASLTEMLRSSVESWRAALKPDTE